MKKSFFYSFLVLSLSISCTSDDSDAELISYDPGFSFKISGDINKTISGSIAYSATGSEPDIFGEDLNTTSFSAVDSGNGQVSFGITTYDIIGKGTYPVEFRLTPEAYNGYINFVEDPRLNPVYGPTGGSIILKSLSNDKISGSLDVKCFEPNSKKPFP
jgi:hypothetical protein